MEKTHVSNTFQNIPWRVTWSKIILHKLIIIASISTNQSPLKNEYQSLGKIPKLPSRSCEAPYPHFHEPECYTVCNTSCSESVTYLEVRNLGQVCQGSLEAGHFEVCRLTRVGHELVLIGRYDKTTPRNLSPIYIFLASTSFQPKNKKNTLTGAIHLSLKLKRPIYISSYF